MYNVKDVLSEPCFAIEPYDDQLKRLYHVEYSCSDNEKIMPKIISNNMIMNAMLSAFFSSMTGSLLVLIYLCWEKSGTSAFDMLSLILTYVLIGMTSLTGTITGSLIIGIPVVMASVRFYPDDFVKGSFFIMFSTLFIWLVVLAWPVTRIFGASYPDVLLLSPYAFCSAAVLAYLVYRK